MKYRLKKEDRVWTVQCRCWDMRLNRRYGSESLNTTAISAWFRQHFLFPHFQKKMFMSSCNLHIHWSVLKKGKPIIMWCSKPATWTRDSLSDSSFFFSFSHCLTCEQSTTWTSVTPCANCAASLTPTTAPSGSTWRLTPSRGNTSALTAEKTSWPPPS